MKKLFFALVACSLLISATSCHKCGYCRKPSGNDPSYCQSSSVIPGVPSDYDEAKSNCQGQGGTWVVTK